MTAVAGLVLGSASAQVYVDAFNQTPGDGSSWDESVQSLPEGLALLGPLQPQDRIIYVAVGIYTPDVPATGDPRNATFAIPPGTKLFGGFLTGETPETSSKLYRQTILDGDIGQEMVIDDNCYSVVTVEPSSIDETLIDGFLIRNGNANLAGSVPDDHPGINGGGIYAAGAHLQLLNLFVQFNRAKREGGGVYFRGEVSTSFPPQVIGSSLRVFRSYFQFNIASERGGGLSAGYYVGDYQDAEFGPSWIYNSTFERNFAGDPGVAPFPQLNGGGGLMLFRDGGSPRTVATGPAGFPGVSATMVLANNRFYSNSVAGAGAACRIDDLSDHNYFVNNTFAANKVAEIPSGLGYDAATVYVESNTSNSPTNIMAASIVSFPVAPDGSINTMNAVDGPGTVVFGQNSTLPRLLIYETNAFTTAAGAMPAFPSTSFPNYDIDPLFESVATFDLRLASNSSMLDNAFKGWLPGDYPDTDEDGDRGIQTLPRHFLTGAGEDRVANGIGGVTDRDLDVGAFERQ